MMRSPMFGTGVTAGPSAIARAVTSRPGVALVGLGGIAAGVALGTNVLPALPSKSQSNIVAGAAGAGAITLGVPGIGLLISTAGGEMAVSATRLLKQAAVCTALTAGAFSFGRGALATGRNQAAADQEWIAGRPQRLEENGIGRLERTEEGKLRGNVVAPSDSEYQRFPGNTPLFRHQEDSYHIYSELLTNDSLASYSNQADAVRALNEDWGDGAVIEHKGRFVHVGVGLDGDSEKNKARITPNADGSIDGSWTDSTEKVVAMEVNGKVYQPFENALYPVKEWDES